MESASVHSGEKKGLMILLPFAVADALLIRIARALRRRGERILCLIQQRDAGPYKRDGMEDFAETGDLIDLSYCEPRAWQRILQNTISERDIGGILQAGAPNLYPLLGRLRQESPALSIGDILYNQEGHVVRHFLYERAIDRVFVESIFMRKMVENSTSIPDRIVDVLYSGVDLGRFTSSDRKRSRQLTLGFVGRFSEEKGVLEFIRLADTLIRVGHDVRFAVFGSGPLDEVVRSRCSAGAAANRITFGGYVPDVRSAFAAIDVLVVPSRTDGRPVGIMEAGACGVPVIAAPVGGIPEMVSEGVNGWTVAPQDIARISEIVSMFIDRPHFLDAARREARLHAERFFSESRMLDAYQAALRSLAESDRRLVRKARI